MALVLTVLGLATQILGILTRGLSEHRVPWGNMYEFVTAITCAAVIAFLLMCLRFRVYSIGLFFLAPIVLGLGLCATVLYTAAGPLVPALHSYWIWIHVTAMTLAIGAYILAAVLTVLYLFADRHARRGGATDTGFGAILHRLPGAEALDRLSYRTAIFAFPIWTFGIIAGAIWADQAWGRYWGWDPKETWAFITWVVYAGYLHAGPPLAGGAARRPTSSWSASPPCCSTWSASTSGSPACTPTPGSTNPSGAGARSVGPGPHRRPRAAPSAAGTRTVGPARRDRRPRAARSGRLPGPGPLPGRRAPDRNLPSRGVVVTITPLEGQQTHIHEARAASPVLPAGCKRDLVEHIGPAVRGCGGTSAPGTARAARCCRRGSAAPGR